MTIGASPESVETAMGAASSGISWLAMGAFVETAIGASSNSGIAIGDVSPTILSVCVRVTVQSNTDHSDFLASDHFYLNPITNTIDGMGTSKVCNLEVILIIVIVMMIIILFTAS